MAADRGDITCRLLLRAFAGFNGSTIRSALPGNGGKLGVRLGLIPVGHRGDVVLQRQVRPVVLPTQRLDRHLHVLLEADRVGDVPAIEAETLRRLT